MQRKSIFLFPIFLIMYELSVNLSNDMYLPAVADMISFFQADSVFVQRTLTAWFAGAMLMNPVLGMLSDNVGRKKILLGSGILFLCATLYCAFPSNTNLFLVARCVQGLTVTSIVVCGYALIHELYDNNQAILIIAWMSAALITAPMLGPLLGGYVIYLFNWHYIFLFLFLIALIALIGLYYFMPQLPIVKQDQKVSLLSELHTYKNILTSKKFMLGTIMYSLLFGGLIAWITASPFLIVVQHQYSPLSFGIMQMPIFGSYIIGIFALKLAIKYNFGEEKIIFLGMAVLAIVSSLFLLFILQNKMSLFFLISLTSLYAFAYGMIASPLNRVSVTSLDYGMGKIMAMFDLLMGLTATITTMIVSVNTNIIIHLSFLICGFVALTLLIYVTQFQLLMRSENAKSLLREGDTEIN